MKNKYTKMISLANKLQNLQLFLNGQHGQEVGYGRALREAIVSMDLSMEVEVLKSLGDIHLQKGKLSKDVAVFDKAAGLYSAALLRCTDPDMGQTLEHRISYMEKLCRQLLQGYTPKFQWLSADFWGTKDNNVLRVAEFCSRLEESIGKSCPSIEEIYTETLVTTIRDGDIFLELESLKSLGDLYLEKGKKTTDVSQFSKAAAMYGKALTRCGDPETKQTLHHRILYMVKIWQIVTRVFSSIFSQCRDHLKKGNSFLARADLVSAEQHFAAALKMVHVRDSTAQQYQREVEPLCKLGDVYRKRGQQTRDGGEFVKAAALYNAAIARSKDKVFNCNVVTAIKEVETSFLKSILGIQFNVSQDYTETHKKQLEEMRDQIKLEMKTIDQQLDPYVHDEDDPCVKEIEAKRAQAVRQLFDNIAQERKVFISLLVEECTGVMGPPPCKYALIGLGSQATGLVTPYSDLEFAILVEEEREECLVYFRNLTHYLHLKVVNLGETILPALGIKCINDFYSKDPLDSWYYDSVTPRGFAFDGSMPKASKTPLGRQLGTMNVPPSELICTPENMVSKLHNDVTLYLKEGYHLATILRNPCLIAGDQDLIDTYTAITAKILQADGVQGTMYFELCKDRLAIGCYVKALEKAEDPDKKMSMLSNLGDAWSSVGDYLKSISYYEQALQMHRSVYGHVTAHPNIATSLNNLGLSWQRLGDHRKAISYLEQALQMKRSIYGQSAAHLDIATTLNNLGGTWRVIGNYRKAISYYEQALQIQTDSHGRSTAHPHIAGSLNNLGTAWLHLGDNSKAISYHEEAVQMCRSIYGQTSAHPHIANLFQNLGGAWNNIKDYRRAIGYYELALQIYRSIYGQSAAHPLIADLLNNIGGTWQSLGDHGRAVRYLEQGLRMYISIYGQSTAHPHIAGLLHNLGSTLCYIHSYRTAVKYLEQALQMYRSIYGQSTSHPHIASSLNNLASALHHIGDNVKAVSYYEQALHMCRSMHGQGTAHLEMATTLDNLGQAWRDLGDHRKAISYYEQALQIKRSIYGQGTAHPDIASSLSNLGVTWFHLGEHKKAISVCQEALAMASRIYPRGHPITKLLEVTLSICLYNTL
ncbi:TTC28 [Branchiostoma lanceolatum]|uniref:TTC28 protein n=1 Tax=Branchiostoma lanceolatum TaxID=7740 RepID=A0A8J9YR66_BRALA|nr:TTC28 [Branchiostoma lanceolatum]